MIYKLAFGFLGLLVLAVAGYIITLILFHVGEQRYYDQLTDTRDLQTRIDTLAANYVKSRPNVWLVIGVLQKDQRHVRGYGQQRPIPAVADDKLIYEIGSITKVFTGTLLGQLVAEGVVQLEVPISKHLPATVVVPEEIGKLTLRQLATHTSGLPRLPYNFDEVSKNDANPYVDYKVPDLYHALKTARLESKPGTKSSYSNFGMGLLGHLLSLKAGQSYEEMVRNRICVPLGMKDTALTLSPELQTRLVPGYSPDGKPAAHWDFDVLAPTGAIHSTADDLLTFLATNLKPDDKSLGKGMRTAQEEHYKDWMGIVGLGWQIEDNLYLKHKTHWHNGGTGGFVSWAGLVKGKDVAVVAFANYGDAFAGKDDLDRLGAKILGTATKVALAAR